MLESGMSPMLALAAALAAPAVSLPADEDPAAWADALAFAGLGVAEDGELVLEQVDGAWRLCIAARCLETPAPETEQDREAIALLARSLARELEMPRGPAPTPATPRLRAEPVALPAPAPLRPESAPDTLVRTGWPAPTGPALTEPPPWRTRLLVDLGASSWGGEALAPTASVAAWRRAGPVFVRAEARGSAPAELQGAETRAASRLGGGLGLGVAGQQLDSSLSLAVDRETWRQDGELVARLALPSAGAQAGWRWPIGDGLALRASLTLDASLREVELATPEGTFADRARFGAGARAGLVVGR